MFIIRSFALSAIVLLSACAHSPIHDPADPLESMNRHIFNFNLTADKYVLRPVAQGYATVVPGFARTGINNFFDNLFYPSTIINQYLQGKLAVGTADLGRFLVNTTLGLGGFIDVAAYWGLPKHNEDLGQTFAHWGVGEGWYIMLPIVGPSTNRDLVGRIGGTPLNPMFYYEESELIWGMTILDAVQSRAQLLQADALLRTQLDPYLFVRSAYLQQRWSAIHDGNPPTEELDFENFDDF